MGEAHRGARLARIHVLCSRSSLRGLTSHATSNFFVRVGFDSTSGHHCAPFILAPYISGYILMSNTTYIVDMSFGATPPFTYKLWQ
jgi:hypothetical protein